MNGVGKPSPRHAALRSILQTTIDLRGLTEATGGAAANRARTIATTCIPGRAGAEDRAQVAKAELPGHPVFIFLTSGWL